MCYFFNRQHLRYYINHINLTKNAYLDSQKKGTFQPMP